MKLLFVHQDMPGQFKHLAPALARMPGNQVVFLTKRTDAALPHVHRLTYAAPRAPSPDTHHYLRLYEDAVLHGQQAARLCLRLKSNDFIPDVVIAHPGWGEALFIKDVFPKTRVLSYCEFYYQGLGSDIGFDPESPSSLDTICQARARNAHLLLSLELCDQGLSPTRWQRDRHPPGLRDKISVIFDGIDTDVVKPNPAARFVLPSGRVLTAGDEVVTYVARNLEPYRGFPSFMRALPHVIATRPDAHIVIVGGKEISYGRPPANGESWQTIMLREVGGLDPTRVHFLDPLPYQSYLRLLQVSRVHVYLTVPFVLSWSFMEALAAGCVVVGSRTPPVQEIIENGQNGLLADFMSPADIAGKVIDVLQSPHDFRLMRNLARQTVMEHYGLARCLPKQIELVRSLA